MDDPKNIRIDVFGMRAGAEHVLKHLRTAQRQMEYTCGERPEPWTDHTQEWAAGIRRIPEVDDAFAKIQGALEAVEALRKVFGAKKGDRLFDYLPDSVDKSA